MTLNAAVAGKAILNFHLHNFANQQTKGARLAFYLALDVGGTKTEYVLADDTRELARVRGGTIKRMRTDADTAAQNLDKALAELAALQAAHGRPALIAACRSDRNAAMQGRRHGLAISAS